MTHEPRCTGTKVCTKCGRELPVLAFPANHSGADGLTKRNAAACQKRHRFDLPGEWGA